VVVEERDDGGVFEDGERDGGVEATPALRAVEADPVSYPPLTLPTNYSVEV